MRDRLFAAIERAGAIPLALAPLGHRAIATIADPVRTPDDVAGLRVRTLAMPFLVDFYAGLGARPFAMPFAEAADAFRSGGLDAQEGPVATFAAMRPDALGFRHLTLLAAVGEIAVFAVNRGVWEGWTADQRALVGDAARDIARGLSAVASAEEEAALASIAGRGMSVLRLTGSGRAAFAAAARRTYDKWAAVAGEDLVRAAESAARLPPAAP
jgi:TRAP-type C4-dicarboxylate transport system substrate-binding protein